MIRCLYLLICLSIISCDDTSTHELEPILESNMKTSKYMAEDCFNSNLSKINGLIEEGSYDRGLYLNEYRKMLVEVNNKYQQTIDSYDRISINLPIDIQVNRSEILYKSWIDFNRKYIPTRFDSLRDFEKYFANDFNKLITGDSIVFSQVVSLVKKNSKNPKLINLLLKNKFINSYYKIQTYVAAISPQYNNCMSYEKFAFIATSDKGVIIRNGYAEITAGMGTFNDKNNPIIKINNRKVKINEDGISMLKVKVPSKRGNFSIPVEINFTSRFGESKKLFKNIDIVVVDSICD
jgi:hypothetical protein